MSLPLILLILLIIILVGALPHWGYQAPWTGYGYYPSGIVGIIVIVLVILLLTGRL